MIQCISTGKEEKGEGETPPSLIIITDLIISYQNSCPIKFLAMTSK